MGREREKNNISFLLVSCMLGSRKRCCGVGKGRVGTGGVGVGGEQVRDGVVD